MRPTCAACEKPITSRDQFVIGGTEVFHRGCVGQSARSLGVRRHLMLVALEKEVRAAEARLATLEEQQATDEQRWKDALRKAVRTASEGSTKHIQEKLALARELESHRQRVAALEAEVTRLQALQTPTPPAAPVEEPTRIATADDTETRFSLLELD